VANAISILRVLLAFVVVALLCFFKAEAWAYWAGFGLTVLVIAMDGLDGYVARKFNEVSQFGAMLDILSDRVVELTYWISFAVWLWVPIWVPLVVMARGIVVDGIRSVAQEHGLTAFGMMKHPLGVLLVSSRFSRIAYAVSKAAAFALLILAMMPGDVIPPVLYPIAMGNVYIAVAFCVVRGLPVLLEVKQFKA
jgi:CDP-diacylglycerol---glycerol-3-phosphate 3-phosphatidyltransferase